MYKYYPGFLKNRFFLIILFFSCFFSFSQDYKPLSSGEYIDHVYYSLSYSEKHEQALWVYYTLDINILSTKIKRTNNFRKDPMVSTGSSYLSDYRGSGYDRGHLAPAADLKINKSSMSSSFYLSNISPQVPAFNRGIWKKLESFVRKISYNSNFLHVFTGPIFLENKGSIGINKVTVPGYYYKIIYIEKTKEALAFILPNNKTVLSLDKFICSIDQIELLTNIDFLNILEDSLENSLEKKINTKLFYSNLNN